MVRSLLQDALRLGIAAAIILAAFCAGLWIWGAWNDEWSGFNAQYRVSDGSCNIAVVSLAGDITTLPLTEDDTEELASYPTANVDDILFKLRVAEYDPYVEGILFRIDSYGGMPVGSEILADALSTSPLPVVALIREAGVSGGYMAATGADAIFASPMSDVGGIGVTMSYVDNVAKNAKEGLGYVQLSSAPYKDYGDPNKPLTAAERAIFLRDLELVHDAFVNKVAKNRDLSEEEVAKLADGSSMTGVLALEHKLIDELGNQADTRGWFARELGLTVDEVQFCE